MSLNVVEQHFHKCPELSDWDRFLGCASRVRRIELSPLALRMDNLIAENTFDVLADSRPPGITTIFPRLHSINVSMFGLGSLSGPLPGDLFFHSGVQEVTLDVSGFDMVELGPDEDQYGVDVDRAYTLFSEIPRLSPNIEKLVIMCEGEHMHYLIRDAVCELLRNLKNLRSFSSPSPPDEVTPKFVTALRHHQFLRTITSMDDGGLGDLLSSDEQLDEDASYPALELLEFCGYLSELPKIFDGQTPQFLSLTHLWIKIVLSDPKQTSTYAVMGGISWHCPNLERLWIVFVFRGRFDDFTKWQLTAEELHPLRSLEWLHLLQIQHYRGVAINDFELVEFIRHFPDLDTLSLNHFISCNDDGEYDSLVSRAGKEGFQPLLTLNSLVLLSQIENQLRSLGIYADASNVHGIDAVVGRHLGELEEIDFGNSLTPNCTSCEGEISRFLAMVLPLECTITTCGVEQKNSVKWKKLKENVDKLREHPCDAYDRGEYFTTGDWHPHSRPMTWINGNC